MNAKINDLQDFIIGNEMINSREENVEVRVQYRLKVNSYFAHTPASSNSVVAWLASIMYSIYKLIVSEMIAEMYCTVLYDMNCLDTSLSYEY